MILVEGGGPSCFRKRKATSLIANMLDNKGILLGSAQNMLMKQDGQKEESHWEKPSGTQDPKHVMLVLGFFWTLGSYDLMVIYWNILEIENVYLRPLLKQIPKDTFHDLKVLAFKAFFFFSAARGRLPLPQCWSHAYALRNTTGTR